MFFSLSLLCSCHSLPLLQPILYLSFNPLSQQPQLKPKYWNLAFETKPPNTHTPSFSCVKLSQVPTLMEWRSLWSDEAIGRIGGSDGTWPLYRRKIPKIPFVLLFLVPLFPLSLPIYLCACLLCTRFFFFLENRYV